MSESKGASRSRSSAGMPDTSDARVAELEERLARLEGGPGLKDRGRHMLNRVMPPEATTHFFNAGREQLLGVRAIVDFWLRRIDDMESTVVAEPGRESIEID